MLNLEPSQNNRFEVLYLETLYKTDVRYWVWLYGMFTGTVELGGKVAPRFKKI